MAGRDGKFDGKPEADAEPGGFLGRWSRRKAEAKTADATDPTCSADLEDAEAASDLTAEDTVSAPKETDAQPDFDVASLPDIDSLGPGSDFSMFMRAGVPQELKTRALRKLWRVKPELANLDGLLDYGEDLTGSFKVVDHLKTAYEVGRGFLKDKDTEPETAGEPTDDGLEATDDGTGATDHEVASAETEVEGQPVADDMEEPEPDPAVAEPTGKS